MFYGWRIEGVSAASQSLAIGMTFFSYGALVKPVATEFESPRLAVVQFVRRPPPRRVTFGQYSPLADRSRLPLTLAQGNKGQK